MKKDRKKLELWQSRLTTNETAYAGELGKMDERERLYNGSRTITPVVKSDKKTEAAHVRNICAEIIEAQVSSEIPQPKVTARRKKDEAKAKLIEDMLRNELDRMPFEALMDMVGRTVPIQGGALYHIEWDNTERTHTTVGELSVSMLHPKQVIPQDGIYSGIEDMDYIILKVPQTREYIKSRYGIDLDDEPEAEPDIRGAGDDEEADDLVTQYIAYYRGEIGIGLFSWCGDEVLEDIEDYQARRLRRCATCGAIEPLTKTATEDAPDTYSGAVMMPGADAAIADAQAQLDKDAKPRTARGIRKECPYCGGSKWEESREDYEELYEPVMRSDGTQIGGMVPVTTVTDRLDDAFMPTVETVYEPTRIPFYKPDIFPVILQKNVSVYGKFLGGSDIDKIADHQNLSNRLEQKIIDKIMNAGSLVTLPPDTTIEMSSGEMKKVVIKRPEHVGYIGVHTLEGDVSQDMAYLAQIYEESRQEIGITDSYQGRRDTTANSGKAKEFAAAQSAGRLESKRVMREAAFADLFEAMFKFKLAYADEPRPVVSKDVRGNAQYNEFNRYDFLEQDAAGEWYWNDQFLFSCDTSAPLASNREAMWQETRNNFASGTFGDPTSLETLIMFWTKMELLHYPGAGDTKAMLEDRVKRQQEAEQAKMAEIASQPVMAQGQAMQMPGELAANTQMNGNLPMI